jgi:hypothetical protein
VEKESGLVGSSRTFVLNFLYVAGIGAGAGVSISKLGFQIYSKVELIQGF